MHGKVSANHDLGREGVRLLATSIKEHKRMRKLKLSGSAIGDDGASDLAASLSHSDTMQSLHLGAIATHTRAHTHTHTHTYIHLYATAAGANKAESRRQQTDTGASMLRSKRWYPEPWCECAGGFDARPEGTAHSGA